MALIAMLISSLSGLAFPYVTGQLVDSALPGSSGRGFAAIDTIALSLVGVLGLQAVFSYFQSVWFVEVGERILAAIRKDTYATLIRLPMTYYASRRTGFHRFRRY